MAVGNNNGSRYGVLHYTGGRMIVVMMIVVFFMIVLFDNDKHPRMRKVTAVLTFGYVAVVLGALIGAAIHGV